MAALLLVTGLAACAVASPVSSPASNMILKRDVRPQVAGTPQVIANVTDPAVTRDSCASVKIGARALWTCRDTEPYYDGSGHLPLITNTAGWTDFSADGSVAITSSSNPVGAGSDGSNPILLMYGGNPTSTPAFYPVLSDECPDSGACSDGSRYAIWPDSPTLITSDSVASSGSATGYTWIAKAHISGLTALDRNPAHTLYKLTYTATGDSNALPSVAVVDENFWAEGEIGYGRYGGLVQDGYAYLYGQTDPDNKGTALARVPVDRVENKSEYRYFVSGAWTDQQPAITDSDAIISNAGAGGQGTFYYSEHFQSYIWIGQGNYNHANFLITTAPAPEGPWIEPYDLYQGANGDNGIAGGYTLTANPALLKDPSENAIYLSWTQQFDGNTYGAYVTPLVYLQFQ
ncbi:hypothetical protein K431DRAFT_284318 [Polychaeton citri CBS 116435]|uniref:DUF4185 domain-containing protein n=1 Tax=Polychaeton citri CBS 116435 TaxID=1314669 RepID=A0A9P4Q7N1_9PEZI|nr:hypothetical protein K431DRAFT_284318 [Polychaeton citri CBS 116435]